MIINGQLTNVIFFTQGDTAEIEGLPLSVHFTGAGTATLDNGDVLSDASFNITVNGIITTVNLETINGKSSSIEIEGYIFVLEFADGYSQTCGLLVDQNR